MDPTSIRIVSSSTRPPSVHSLRSALKTLDLPSMPPTVPLPPLPTSPSSCKSRTATFTIGSPRPTTGSTKKNSFTSLTFRPHKPIKYGTGKFSHVELVPQPSDDPQDPLVSCHTLVTCMKGQKAERVCRLLELASMEEGVELGIPTLHG